MSMQIIGDLHIHSKYSRGCSTNLDINNLEKYARVKGVDLLGTGDFTHPKWIEELKKLREEDGILKTESGFPFVCQTELSLIYSQDGKGRRVHNVVLAPNLEVVDQITDELKKRGRVDYDGRPIFKIPCPEFVEMLNQISPDIEVIPAHIWTPWFSMFGENSGFNTVKDCFQDKTNKIHALETGMSSDPAMNWRLSQLDKFNLVSFSDLHSFWPWRIGREATEIDLKKLTYKNILNAIRDSGITRTIEVDPNYGKYHLTGHRKCNVCLEPKESVKLNDVCPVCKKKLTVGVLERVEELADREEGYVDKNRPGFITLIPLSEIIAHLYGFGVATKKVWDVYNQLIDAFKSEFNIMLNVSKEELAKVVDERLADAIINNREGKIKVKAGYDGVYGEPVFKDKIKELSKKQASLSDF
ncbi:endonuclease Q family protein [Nanoarchaeota archaeon]